MISQKAHYLQFAGNVLFYDFNSTVQIKLQSRKLAHLLLYGRVYLVVKAEEFLINGNIFSNRLSVSLRSFPPGS